MRWRGARPSRNVSGPIMPANYVVSRRRFCPIGPALCLLYIGGGPDPIKDNYRCLRRSAIILNDQALDCFLRLTCWNGILVNLLSLSAYYLTKLRVYYALLRVDIAI